MKKKEGALRIFSRWRKNSCRGLLSFGISEMKEKISLAKAKYFKTGCLRSRLF
jgi:hypothetical protein